MLLDPVWRFLWVKMCR